MSETLDLTGLTKKERRALKKEPKEETASQGRGRSLLLWGTVVLGIVATMIWLVFAGKPKTETQVVGNQEVTEADWKRGAVSPKVTLVEYSDLQCPACAAYQPMVEEILRSFPDDLVLVYRHFPLRQLHPNAQLAGQAAEAAGNQGKFWEMHDLFFARQSSWAEAENPKETFIGYANELGLDEEKFKQDLGSDETKQKVEEDYRDGLEARVNATPTFILDGKKIANPRTIEEFVRLVEQALQ